jgi:hypothetical protein
MSANSLAPWRLTTLPGVRNVLPTSSKLGISVSPRTVGKYTRRQRSRRQSRSRPALAYLHQKPCRFSGCARFLHGGDGQLPYPLCPGCDGDRPPLHPAYQCHRASGGMDSAAVSCARHYLKALTAISSTITTVFSPGNWMPGSPISESPFSGRRCVRHWRTVTAKGWWAPCGVSVSIS